jgi:hypothetical protein
MHDSKQQKSTIQEMALHELIMQSKSAESATPQS